MSAPTDLARWGPGGVLWRSLLLINALPVLLMPLGLYVAHYLPVALTIGGVWLVSMALGVAIKPAERGQAWAAFGLRCWVFLLPLALVCWFAAVPWLRVEVGIVEALPTTARPDPGGAGAATGYAPMGHKTPRPDRSHYYAVVMPMLLDGASREDPVATWALATTLGPGDASWPATAHMELVASLAGDGRWLVDPVGDRTELAHFDWGAAAVEDATRRHGLTVAPEPRFARLEPWDSGRDRHRTWTLWVFGITNAAFLLWWLRLSRRRLDPHPPND